ncbi:MAG: Mut7-C RNAse domain-containing protein [Acidobacteria bacterium]|nr:Mut7-C RNAse domain-containing protein [Acidobacteriota bacterium]
MPRFVADAMLGTLARWLRFFGYDCVFTELPDDEVLRRARSESRWLLTRDRELASRGPRTLLVKAERLDEQVAEVISRLGLAPAPTLERARCGSCNGLLEPTPRAVVQTLVPPHVAATAERFRRCTECGRVYWPGSHSRRIVARMERMVAVARVVGAAR